LDTAISKFLQFWKRPSLHISILLDLRLARYHELSLKDKWNRSTACINQLKPHQDNLLDFYILRQYNCHEHLRWCFNKQFQADEEKSNRIDQAFKRREIMAQYKEPNIRFVAITI